MFQRRIRSLSVVALPFAAIAFTAGWSPSQSPTVQRELTLGCESCGGVVQFGSIWDVAVSARGEFLVVDRDAPMLRRFDQTGKPVWSGGNKGRGPGEYQLIVRASLLANGGIVIVDMTNQRVTELAPDMKAVGTIAVPRFPTTAGAGGDDIVIAAEGPMGTLDLWRWRHGAALTKIELPRPGSPGDPRPIMNSSVALSPLGTIAALLNSEHYSVIRIDSAGARLPNLERSVERVRNTSREEAEIRDRIARSGAMMNAERRAGGRSAAPVPQIPESERRLKPHVAVDGMRYDPSGRLWLRTMRGDETKTLFDVFNPSGAFAGTVTIPGRVQAFGLGGRYLVTAGENDDGVPQVTRWIVR
jgi:hypothetical protein